MNPGAKGSRIEKKCEDEFKKMGYRTWRVHRGRFGGNDFLDAFDVCALDESIGVMYLVQCKSNRIRKRDREKVFGLNLPANCHPQIWAWIDRRGWKKVGKT